MNTTPLNDPTQSELRSVSDQEEVRVEAFSLEILHAQFPDVPVRVEAIWLWLSSLVAEYVPYADRRQAGLVMIDELVALTGFTASDVTRQHFNLHFRR